MRELRPSAQTHVPALHLGALGGQSSSTSQATQAPSGLQNRPGCDTQSALLRHCTQVEVVVLQSGPTCPLQSASAPHPARHVKSPGLQVGVAAGQSPLLTHVTQRPGATRHRGVVPEQSASLAQVTHRCAGDWQTFVSPVQSDAARHPTHTPAPELVSQIGASFGQSPFVAHPG